MQVRLHQNARTTSAIRRELRDSAESSTVLARRFNLSPITVRKWRARESTENASLRPKALLANLYAAQEFLVVAQTVRQCPANRLIIKNYQRLYNSAQLRER